MSELTEMQLTQEALYLTEVFGERVRNGTARQQKNHLYAIDRPLRPRAQSSPSTVYAPQYIGYNAKELTSRLESGAKITDLPMIRQHFENIKTDLLKVQTYLQILPEYNRPAYADDVVQVINSYLPEISSFIDVADKNLKAEPA